jgi:ferric-dicitrate binding protein FerR (iron transport regulator)
MTHRQGQRTGEPAPPEMRRFARDTRPSAEDVERLRQRMREAPQTSPHWLHRWVPGAVVESGDWLHRWLPGLTVARPSSHRWGLGAGLLAALIALALLRPTAVEPTPLLASAPSELAVSPDVALDFEGQGELSGTEQAPRIAWRRGRVRASVTPNEGIDLRVLTPEAEVRVVGTIFTVDRGALGTRVEVEKGRVEVRCVDGTQRFVVPGEVVWCEPGTAAGYLARARALQRDGAPLPQVLHAVTAGAVLHGPAPVQVELQWVRTEALRDHGRHAAALRAAAAALDAGAGHREADFAALVAGVP